MAVTCIGSCVGDTHSLQQPSAGLRVRLDLVAEVVQDRQNEASRALLAAVGQPGEVDLGGFKLVELMDDRLPVLALH